jgi:hypothetical protein
MQLLGNALDVVQPVHANYDLATLEPVLELLEPVVDLGVAQAVDKLHRLDTDGVGADLGVSALKLDSVGHGLEAEDAGARGEEVTGVVVCVEAARADQAWDHSQKAEARPEMEKVENSETREEWDGEWLDSPDEVALEHTEKDLPSYRQDTGLISSFSHCPWTPMPDPPVDLARGERRVEEKANPDAFFALLLRRCLLHLEGAHPPVEYGSLALLAGVKRHRLPLLFDVIEQLHALVVGAIGYTLVHAQNVLDDTIVHALLDPPELPADHLPLSGLAGDDGPEQHREKHEVVVLHPNNVSGLDHGGDDVGEPHVGLAVGEPVFAVKVHLSGVVVEQRPQDGVGEAWEVSAV